MPSAQNSAGSGKAAKFINANPLGPMANPFEGMDDDEKEYQKVVGENVNKRMEKVCLSSKNLGNELRED